MFDGTASTQRDFDPLCVLSADITQLADDDGSALAEQDVQLDRSHVILV